MTCAELKAELRDAQRKQEYEKRCVIKTAAETKAAHDKACADFDAKLAQLKLDPAQRSTILKHRKTMGCEGKAPGEK
jgi:hypothetical protein